MSLRSALRAQTSDCHAEVDTIFGRFDLSDPPQYSLFLSAHARIVPVVEMALEHAGIIELLPDWPERRRRELLTADLADLGVKPPPLLEGFIVQQEAELWGAAYVLEGSKLGGAMLAKSVTAGLPARYLTPNGPRGSIKVFMDRLDEAAIADPETAISAARDVFALFRRAAEIELELVVS
ncbi:biliverdin-producing heme oxygenase [Rhizobium grahamii]|uniref:Biliverdin-producing heme oxygenase n=1 Tax=Rhizobium grahamii TaxID=1120045 RepID=A0A5Q0C971_9HYPH|nr:MULTISPECIES: biliverdin-producing heme oxygenase [Rhizobium]QFY60944.1 biliverdin-producing heme oxygenase [Rhizobium grahamii]QRM49904.1 biliverdin-producing heme oxygenase [Rhizobium sp. BG6]